jgi:hypothetical protein
MTCLRLLIDYSLLVAQQVAGEFQVLEGLLNYFLLLNFEFGIF